MNLPFPGPVSGQFWYTAVTLIAWSQGTNEHPCYYIIIIGVYYNDYLWLLCHKEPKPVGRFSACQLSPTHNSAGSTIRWQPFLASMQAPSIINRVALQGGRRCWKNFRVSSSPYWAQSLGGYCNLDSYNNHPCVPKHLRESRTHNQPLPASHLCTPGTTVFCSEMDTHTQVPLPLQDGVSLTTSKS